MRGAGPALGFVVVAAAAGCTAAPIEIATLGNDALTNGLIAHWALDEGSGAAVMDSSGNGHNGVLEGPAWTWITGQFGGAVHFSGNDSVSVAGFPPATASYSVSAWVLIASDELGPPVGNLLSTEVLGGGWSLFAQPLTGNLNYIFRYATTSQQYATTMGSKNSLQADAWTHLTCVLDADAGSLTLYMGPTPAMSIPVNSEILPGSTTLQIGRSAGLQPPFGLIGAMDDIAIYNRALQPQEIAALDSARAPDPQ